ncbi:hypothetical protein LY78DRAFT_647307 [Colletotrichum sublineola]|nr:hypothetical protein LY78DRAFT_647307 [Colletotrichum sublineola]
MPRSNPTASTVSPARSYDELEMPTDDEEFKRMFVDAEDFLSDRPFFKYVAFNWHEHVILGGDSALQILCDASYATIIDISKPQFWAWFLPLAEYINGSVTRSGNRVRSKAPLSSLVPMILGGKPKKATASLTHFT